MKRVSGAAARFFLILVLIAAAFSPIVSAQDSSYPLLEPGGVRNSSVILGDSRPAYQTFRFVVPDTAVGIRVSLQGSRGDLDLFAKHGAEITSYSDVDAGSETDLFNEELVIMGFGDGTLKSGGYFLDVAYQLESPPVEEGTQLGQVPFSIRYEVMEPAVEDLGGRIKEAEPSAGGIVVPVEGTLDPEQGMAAVYRLFLPADAEDLRIDLYDTYTDCDLFLGFEGPVYRHLTADLRSESFAATESLHVSLVPGRKKMAWITVTDQVSREIPQRFQLLLSFRKDPPSRLRQNTHFPETDNPLEQALLATVELVGNNGTGSGCIIGKEGLILTNRHVILSGDGSIPEQVIVGVNLDRRRPAAERFLAEVLECDEAADLALLRVVSDRYGFALPEGLRFPAFDFGKPEEVAIGDRLVAFGYPDIGGSGSRTSITFSRGVVSGYDRVAAGVILKTDAEINSGSSGGAACTGDFKLIGLPTSIIGQDSGQIAYIHPVSLIPEVWREKYNLGPDTR
ncbi:MAG: serine protease [Spirochaetales bacterium]|nr:serine protease [Spirochaetales bacterium]MCF7936985.1 serine protease [Spirochaetales bacterium]